MLAFDTTAGLDTPSSSELLSMAIAQAEADEQNDPRIVSTGPSPYSGHGIDTFIRCPQLWAFKYGPKHNLGTCCTPDGGAVSFLEASGEPNESDESEALVSGSMGHQGLAQWYRRIQARQQGENPEQWLKPLNAIEARGKRGGLWADLQEKATATVEAYCRHYRGENWTVLGVEGLDQSALRLTLNADLEWIVTRSADLVMTDTQGKVWIFDHKFVGKIRLDTLKRYAIDGQFLDYQIIGQMNWRDRFGGVLLNLIQWPDKEGRIYFLRRPIDPAPAALRDRVPSLRYAFKERQKLLDTAVPPDRWPKRLNEHVCIGPYRACPALNLCRYGVDQKLVLWNRNAIGNGDL